MARRLLFVATMIAAAACGRGAPARGMLELIPAEADVVVEFDLARVRDTWIERAAVMLAQRAELPPCVIAGARSAPRVVVAWARALPEDGLLVVWSGPGAVDCPDAERHRAVVAWGRGLALRRGDAPGFYSDRGRRARLATLAKTPVRAIADVEVSGGIAARIDATLDGTSGAAASAVLRFAEPAPAQGARTRIERWRQTVDVDRLGGATAVVDALAVAGPNPGTPTVELGVTLAGTAGADAAALFVAAIAAGTVWDERTPCPRKTATDAWGVRCVGGELRISVAARTQLVAAPVAALMAWRTVAGTPAVVLAVVERNSPLLALGLEQGDALIDLDGAAVTPAMVLRLDAAALALAEDATAVLRIRRGGRVVTLRYRLVP